MFELYSIPVLISMVAFILTTHITPGPTNIMLLSSALNFGYKKSIPFMIGCVISYPLMMILTGFGVSVFLIKYPTVMLVMKFFGIVYLSWMAWRIATDNSTYDSDNVIKKPFSFIDAFIYTILNPKAWIVYTSILSIFVTSVEESMYQIGIIVLIILISMIITVYVWALGGVILKKFIKNKKFIKSLNLSMAILLIFSIVQMIT